MTTRVEVPDAFTRHAVNRFSYGWTPALQRELDAAGGFQPWLKQQLKPTRHEIDDGFAQTSSRWWVSINATPATIWDRSERNIEKWWVADQNYQRWALVRRIHSRRQVQEVMAEFFEHHLHVPASGENSAIFRADYGRLVREHALGKFKRLLHKAITHPAMGVHLDNALSTRRGVNENLGRELLELFTVGVGNFTERDVKNSAAILTGWRVDVWGTWKVSYEPDDHATGTVRVLGFKHRNRKPDGRKVTKRYLHYLAKHPATARHLARKLAVRFVSDTPSQALVNKLAKVYLAKDTRIAPVLRALAKHPEFKRAAGSKVRTGPDDLVATCRVLGVEVGKPVGPDSAANQLLWQAGNLGELPLAWPRPDGMPDTAPAWSSASRFLASLDLHFTLAGGWWPKQAITHRTPASWLPRDANGRTATSVRFDVLVDHLARSLLGKASTPRLLQACCEATDCQPVETVTVDHAVVRWHMPRLLTTLLDSPDHLTR